MTDFGTDLSAAPLTGRVIGGLDLLTESVARRVRTPRGALFYDAAYGCSLLEYLGEAVADGGAELCAVLELELEDDPRVLSATVTVDALDLRHVQLRCDLTSALGPFALIIAADVAGQRFEVQGVGPDGVG